MTIRNFTDLKNSTWDWAIFNFQGISPQLT